MGEERNGTPASSANPVTVRFGGVQALDEVTLFVGAAYLGN
jgi:hypothetical protein